MTERSKEELQKEIAALRAALDEIKEREERLSEAKKTVGVWVFKRFLGPGLVTKARALADETERYQEGERERVPAAEAIEVGAAAFVRFVRVGLLAVLLGFVPVGLLIVQCVLLFQQNDQLQRQTNLMSRLGDLEDFWDLYNSKERINRVEAFVRLAQRGFRTAPGVDLPSGVVEPTSLRGFDLSGFDLSGANLPEVDFRGADLKKVRFNRAFLWGAKFVRATMTGAKFDHADLRGASLINADLGGASFYLASLSMASLEGASLKGASLASADIGGVNLTGANLQGVDLGFAVSRTDLCKCSDLEGVKAEVKVLRNLKKRCPDKMAWWTDPGNDN